MFHKPLCTIYLDWTGPSCGKDAVTRNDCGGFQCEFHSSLKRCESNPIGPHREIDARKSLFQRICLRIAYAQYLRSIA